MKAIGVNRPRYALNTALAAVLGLAGGSIVLVQAAAA